MKPEQIYTKVVVDKFGDLTLYGEYRDARNWCTYHFGPSKNKQDKGYKSPWYAKRGMKYEIVPDPTVVVRAVIVKTASFHFRDPAHATIFALRWV